MILLISNKLNVCYRSYLSGGITLISFTPLVTGSLEVCKNLISLKSLLFYLYWLKLIPRGKKLPWGGEGSITRSGSIIIILALPP